VEPKRKGLKPAALVIGGGIAGMQASLDIANAGFLVYLVEREPSIGGHMAQLDKTFPTLDCSSCILTPKMVDVARHPNKMYRLWPLCGGLPTQREDQQRIRCGGEQERSGIYTLSSGGSFEGDHRPRALRLYNQGCLREGPRL